MTGRTSIANSQPISQHQLIIKRLRKGWASPIDILNECGSLKASTRIGELRILGHVIEDKWVEQNGKKFKSYRMVK